MENKIKIMRYAILMLLAVSLVFITGCKKDDDDEPRAPVASFEFEINELTATFTNSSLYATSYEWDFGDGAGTSTDKDPSYTFADGGEYAVTLTVSGEGGTNNHTENITVVNPEAPNHIENGTFDDESAWTIIQHNGNTTGTVSIAEGVAVFNEGIQLADWVNDPHVGINQAVTVEAGDYQLNLDITTNGISDVWFEVWVGTSEPVAGNDYNADNGATKVLSFNSWDCGEANNTYSGPMAAVSCQDTDGSITLDADGIYYIVIKTGGLNFSIDGIVIDNVTMQKLN